MVKKKFEKMIEEANQGGFWRERRRLNKDEASQWMATKDEDGQRILDIEGNKENIARYYEKLYKETPSIPHPYHDEVNQAIDKLTNKENTPCVIPNRNDQVPLRDEVKEIIMEKKDKKATTDWKNVLLKRGGEAMVDLIMPVIEAFWREEEVPSQ